MLYQDRTQAAQALAVQLSRYRRKNPLILGIPRGSVPMAKILADALEGEVDVVLAHKVGAPDNPEFAIGAVSEDGTLIRSSRYGISDQEFRALAQQELRKIQKRRSTYSPLRPQTNVKDRIVIVIDDGIATGSTMIAALRAVRSQSPRLLVVAAPVASSAAVDLLKHEANELVILNIPKDFFSISQFYREFPQVTDEEVSHVLREASVHKKSRRQSA